MIIETHPGETLRDEMEARGISANRLALALRVPSGRITEILNGKRAITPDTALRLGRFFGNGARFWLTRQMNFDLYNAEQSIGPAIANEVRPDTDRAA